MKASRVSLLLVVVSCALLGAATPPSTSASAGGLKVLITGNVSELFAGLTAALGAEPGIGSVTTFDTKTATPSARTLNAADVVVDLGDLSYKDPDAYGNRLADYVDHGGVVLQAAYDNWYSIGAFPGGRFLSDHYAPLSTGFGRNSSTTLGEILVPKSPLLQGFDTFATNFNTDTPLAPGATLLAKWADGRNAIAVKGRVVATSAAAYDGTALPDLARLALNAGTYLVAPSTQITKAKINASAGTATFRFKAIGASTGFLCGLGKARQALTFKLCPAHKTYRRLKPGKYTFEAAAVGLGGPDPTPAKKRFKISG